MRYFEGEHADGYLQKIGPSLGYSVVIFRDRHVGDPQSMTTGEHAGFWTDVSSVAKAIEAAFGPIHLNFQILGNQDPHVHVHIVPRYDPDPAPSLPLPAAAWEASSRVGEGHGLSDAGSPQTSRSGNVSPLADQATTEDRRS